MSRGASLAAVAVTTILLAAGCGSSSRTSVPSKTVAARPASPQALAAVGAAALSAHRVQQRRLQRAQPYSIGMVTLRLVDPSRTITTGGGTAPRTLETIVRYPKPEPGSDQAPGPFPLVVFGHGYSVTPQPYAPLLDAWARAGYVVAAPVFPLENANAPDGPDEKDLVNQPADMSLVITSLTSSSGGKAGRVAKLVDARHIAVTGQSDGGDTALATAYDPHQHDPRVGAAMILSGAEDPFAPKFAMPRSGPPLLAVQGTADTINPPSETYDFYKQAAAPKFLLRLVGASHQPPYTEPGPELTAVQRATTAFLDAWLKGRPSALHHLLAAGSAGDDSALTGRG